MYVYIYIYMYKNIFTYTNTHMSKLYVCDHKAYNLVAKCKYNA